MEELLQEGDRLSSYLKTRDLLDLVRDFDLIGLPAEELTPLLRKIPPRLYSVASSQRANPDEVHLTIGLVNYEAGGRVRKGVCSSQCAERIAVGDRIKIYVHRNSNFKLPESPDTPIIMIGPGTGVAPFRSFLEEREETGAEGKTWLFFGDQHYVTDFLYQTDWQRWIKAGVLTKLDLAFSRDTQEKIYVQHRMLAQKEEFFRWLEEGAVVYVCGDEANMAKDVHRTLLQIIKEEGKLSEEEAEAYVQRMQRKLDVTRIRVCYLVGQEPSFVEALDEELDNDAPSLVIVPYLLFDGLLLRYILEEVERKISPYNNLIVCRPLGIDENLSALLKEKVWASVVEEARR